MRDLVTELERWVAHGGTWRVLSRSGSRVTVSLRRCDDGEEVERLEAQDPALLAYLGSRSSSEDEQE